MSNELCPDAMNLSLKSNVLSLLSNYQSLQSNPPSLLTNDLSLHHLPTEQYLILIQRKSFPTE
jgi:hypothetical protein